MPRYFSAEIEQLIVWERLHLYNQPGVALRGDSHSPTFGSAGGLGASLGPFYQSDPLPLRSHSPANRGLY